MRQVVASFCSGAALMMLEILGGRMLAPGFGQSIDTWSSTLVSVLIGLALGYMTAPLFGAAPSQRLGRASALAGCACLAVAHGAKPLVDWASVFPLGHMFVAPLLLVIPTLFLGACTAALVAEQPSAASVLLATSTAGGCVGALVTAHIAIPVIGVHASLLVTAFVCFVATLASGVSPRAFFAMSAIALGLALVPTSQDDGALVSKDSKYQRIVVTDTQFGRMLSLDRRDFVHTISRLDGVPTGFYYDRMVEAAREAHARRVLVLGLGAGELVKQLLRVQPDVTIDAVEIDEAVVEVGEHFFDLNPSARVAIHIADARAFLRQRPTTEYDLAFVDLYQGGPHIPWHCNTREFYAELRAHVRGPIIMNVFNATAATESLIASAFGQVQTERAGANTIIVARGEPLGAVHGATDDRGPP